MQMTDKYLGHDATKFIKIVLKINEINVLYENIVLKNTSAIDA